MGRMRKRRQTGFQNTLGQYKVLQSIADDYDLRMLQVERRNKVFRVNTSQGLKKVKPFKYSQGELQYVHGALEHLAGKGWKRSTPLHLTKGGLPYVETPQGLYYMTTWVQGTEINPEDPFHLEMAVKVLGEMHRLLQDYHGLGESHRQSPPRWEEKYKSQAEDLERYRQQAEGARKGKFGRRFYQVADDFIRMMGIGLQLLYEADYDHVSQKVEFITTCHTSPIASNLIVGNDGKIYVIDFDNARCDLRLYDLARMVVRHSGWDVDKALFIIENYQEANPLAREEISLLPGLCALPNRGWQVARSFYEQGKIHLSRLEMAIEELARQEAFAKALSQIQPGKLVYTPAQLFQTIPYPEPVLIEVDLEKTEVVKLPEVDVDTDKAREDSGSSVGDITGQLSIGAGSDIQEKQLEPILTQEEALLPQPSEKEPARQKVPDFYWGDEDTVFNWLEDEQLRSLRHELASLARRMEAMSDAVFGEEARGGDGWIDEGGVPIGLDYAREEMVIGSEVPVEVFGAQEEQVSVEILGGQGEEILTREVTAETREYLPDIGEEVEVRATVGNEKWYPKEEGEVRLDLAAEMEHINWEVPIEKNVSLERGHEEIMQDVEMPVLSAAQIEMGERVEPGIEIPVEYVAGLELVELEEVSSGESATKYQESAHLKEEFLLEPVDDLRVGRGELSVWAAEAVKMQEDEDTKSVTRVDAPDETTESDEEVVSSSTQRAIWEVVSTETETKEDALQSTVTTDKFEGALLVSEGGMAADIKEAPTLPSGDADALSGVASRPKVGLVEEVGGKAIADDEKRQERSISFGSRPRVETVEWGNFPEPLGGRRRGRERRSV